MSKLSFQRLASVDILRGIVMILMALDHTRDYFTNYRFDPSDLSHSGTAMFLTRWISHFCAPVFIFLAGTSAFLSIQKGNKTTRQAAIFLLKRGFWLIVLELTVIKIGWEFEFDFSVLAAQVIWVIGWSMIFLAGMIFLPLRAIAMISILMIFSHNLLDGIRSEDFGEYPVFWNVLHTPGLLKWDGFEFFVLYPLIPWVGVMGAGYCFGKLLTRDRTFRNFWCYCIGTGAILLFIIIRWTNLYGDPDPWVPQQHWWRSILSFINCQKYPPSLLYLLMTLGPSILALPFLEGMNKKIAGVVAVYGRVPLFFYIVHIYLIHALAMGIGVTMGIPVDYFTNVENFFSPGGVWGYGLPGVYAFWLLIVALMYFPCRWLMRIKQDHPRWWLSYF